MKELRKIFEANHRRLYALALSITKNREFAEDAVHDALVAVANLQKVPDNLTAYLIRVTRNKALFIAQKQQDIEHRDFLELAIQGEQEGSILIQQVSAQMQQLSNTQQQVLTLKLFANLTFVEISELLEVPQNTVSSHYRRGIEQLKIRLNDNE